MYFTAQIKSVKNIFLTDYVCVFQCSLFNKKNRIKFNDMRMKYFVSHLSLNICKPSDFVAH